MSGIHDIRGSLKVRGNSTKAQVAPGLAQWEILNGGFRLDVATTAKGLLELRP